MKLIVQELSSRAKASVPHGLGVDKWIEVYNEKFAELIVRECMKVAHVHSEGSELHDEGTLYYYMEDIAVKIKEHFGVE